MTYTTTRLETILGKYYKYWYLILFRFKGRTVSVFDNVQFVIGQILVLLSSLTVWWLANNKVIDASLQEKWTYFVLGELFFNIIFTFSEYGGYQILRGDFTGKLLHPVNFIRTQFFFWYGESTLQNLVKGLVLLAILAVMIAAGQITFFEPLYFLLYLGLIPFGVLILYLAGMMVAFSAFFLRQINGVTNNYLFVITIAMGRTFPLDLLIPNLYVHFLNPFAYLFYHPMQIYLGNYSNILTGLTYLGGLVWTIVFNFLAEYVLKLGLKKNESVGL